MTVRKICMVVMPLINGVRKKADQWEVNLRDTIRE